MGKASDMLKVSGDVVSWLTLMRTCSIPCCKTTGVYTGWMTALWDWRVLFGSRKGPGRKRSDMQPESKPLESDLWMCSCTRERGADLWTSAIDCLLYIHYAMYVVEVGRGRGRARNGKRGGPVQSSPGLRNPGSSGRAIKGRCGVCWLTARTGKVQGGVLCCGCWYCWKRRRKWEEDRV